MNGKGRRLSVVAAVLAMVTASALMGLGGASMAVAAGPCDAPVVNAVACENTKTGAPSSQWDVSGSGSAALQGFATDISVNRGETVRFKVDTTARSFRIDVYRMGYYGGAGARQVATVTTTTPRDQPACLSAPATGLIDCGNWSESASWAVPDRCRLGHLPGQARPHGRNRRRQPHCLRRAGRRQSV